MASNSILPTFPVFSDVDGNPLESGYIYIGDPGFNPEVAPKNVYWDMALTVPVAQPIRTIGGYPSRSGAPAMMYVDGDYSITVRNKNETLIYSSLNRTFEIDSDELAPDISKVARALYAENTSGVADTLTLSRPDTTITDVTEYYNGLTVMFDNSLSNTGAVTATLNGLASKKVRTSSDTDLVAGDIVAGVLYFLVYNSSLDSGTGAWEIKDTQPQDTYAKLWDPQTTTHNFTSDADYTLTATQNLFGRIVLTDTSVFLTTARNIIVDNVQKSFIVQNDTLQDLTVKTSAGTGILVPAGTSANLYNDGTNVNVIDTTIIDGLGINQTVQDVTASRSSGVTYTNTTGGPIGISIRATNAASSVLEMALTVDGLVTQTTRNPSAVANTYKAGLTAIVPDGVDYIYTYSGHTNLLITELRP